MMPQLKLLLVALAIVVVLVVAILAFAYWRFSSEISADVERLTASARPSESTVTEDMITALPEPAQRYFRYAGVVGHKIPRIVRLTQKGRIRSSESAGWMELEADETYATGDPGFVWRAALPSRALPVVIGRDEYLDGSGSILMKALALMPVADEHGDGLRGAGLMRYLNEAMWFPAALLGPNVTITALDSNSFTATITDRGLTAEAIFFVDADGKLTNFRAQRFNTTTRTMETWETPVSGYRTINGLNLPTTGSAVWKLAGGDLDYIELEITSLAYED